MNFRKIILFARKTSINYKNGTYADFNETSTEDCLIKPFFKNLGWSFENGGIHSQKYIPLPSTVGKHHALIPDIVLSGNGSIHVVIESKRVANQSLSLSGEQSKDQFNATPADIAILTNGIQYWFYSWVFPQKDRSAYMHSTPFAIVDIRHLDMRKHDAFLKYLLYDNFNPTMLKWFNTADHINRQVYSLLKKPESEKDTRIFKTTFIQAMKKYNHYDLDGTKLTRKQLRELYNFTQYHGRWKFTNDKYPFQLHK